MATLRDFVTKELSELPNPRILDVQILVSASKQTTARHLYPYASGQASTQDMSQQDILLLVSEACAKHPPSSTAAGAVPPSETLTEAGQADMLKEGVNETSENTSTSTNRVYVSAIEAVLYTFANARILYIAKIDSTGQGIHPSPTRSVITALLKYLIASVDAGGTPLWVHIFARAQSQYLFPDSALFKGKHVLSDMKLCRWWKSVLDGLEVPPTGRVATRLWHWLPGYAPDEMKISLAMSTRHAWQFTHPYPGPSSSSNPPSPTSLTDTRATDHLPFPLAPSTNISELIPSFPDDPKTRFMAEIAVTHEGQGPPPRSIPMSPPRKRPRTDQSGQQMAEDTSQRESNAGTVVEEPSAKVDQANEWIGSSRFKSISADEFWERMAFRQECSSGAMTGFFVALYSSPPSSGDIQPVYLPETIPLQLHKRLCASLNSNDFSTTERAIRATQILEKAIGDLCRGLPIAVTTDQGPSEAEPDPAATRDFYSKFVHLRIETTKPAIIKASASGRVGGGVTVLTVRKKKKRTAES